MSLVDTTTGEVAVMSEHDARELIDSLRTAVEIAERQIIRAWQGRAWLALGYESWDEMIAHEFHSQYIKIAPDDRRAKAIEMAKVGMSTRAIGSALGASHQTIIRDLNSGGPDGPPDDESPEDDAPPHGIERPDLDEVDDEPAPEPPVVTGLDGKSYPKPAPKPELTPEEQRARDLDESISRHARNLERLISLWPWLSDFAIDPHRDEVIARLTEHDRLLLARIEARLIPLDQEDN